LPINTETFDPSQSAHSSTVFYLAYGSNLSAETFLGRRGIRPISQLNVVVPSLKLTFDLPGLPYVEPCFANSAMRDQNSHPNSTKSSTTPAAAANEKTSLLHPTAHHHKDAWPKGLVGVVYELTPSDFAHVIATEGGGASYHDILVICHPLPTSTTIVPTHPTTPPFKAHTLFAPAQPTPSPCDPPPSSGGGYRRPNTSYAQPSPRYLHLITSGALEHNLPPDYRAYLDTIQPYTITSQKQRLGQFIFVTVWSPVLAFLFGVGAMFRDDGTGRSPEWLVAFSGAVFVAVWASYDRFFRERFGEGERTVGGEAEGEGEESGGYGGIGERVVEEKSAADWV